MVFKTDDPVERKVPRICIPQRYIFGILGFMALSNAYIQRFNLSLTITEMTHPVYHETKDVNDCPGTLLLANKTRRHYEFDWDEEKQGVILSSVFWGYVITQIPGGMIAERYGGKHTLGIGMFCCIVCTLLTPLVVRKTSYIGLIVMRFLIGLGQGPLYPSLNVLLSHWAPAHERSRLGALVFAGAQVGNVISMALTGIIINQFDWTSVFYVYGLLGMAWFVCWLIFVSETPATNRFISPIEKKYLAETVTDITDERKNLPATPWVKILTSAPIWGLIAAQVGHDWGLFTIITDLPKYMKQVLHFSVAQNGVLSALPYLAMWISALISGVVCDWLIEKRGLNITSVRKTFITIAAAGPALGIMAASYSNCNKVAVTISFSVGVGLMGAFVPSLKVNPLDLSPNFAGSLMALVGGVGAVSGIFAPYVVGILTTNGTLLEWRNVFWISSFMLISTNVIYLIWGTAEVQPWNEVSPRQKKGDIKGSVKSKNDVLPSDLNTDVESIETPGSRRASVFINGMPIDPTRKQSVFVARPLIQ